MEERENGGRVVAVVLSIVDDAEALTVVVVPALLLFLSFASSSVDNVACIVVVVDGAGSIHVSWSASLAPVLTPRLPSDGGPTDQKGSVAFLVVLNSCCRHHRLDPGADWHGSVVLGQHGLDCVT